MSIKKFVAIALLPLLVASGNFASAADTPDEQFKVLAPPTNDRYTGINLADGFFASVAFSSLEAKTGTTDSPESPLLTRTSCKKVGDVGCEAERYFQYGALLGECNLNVKTDCITKITATNAAGKEITGRYVEAFPGETALTYIGDSLIDLPTGSSAFIVEFPGIKHQGGSEFLVVAYMAGHRGVKESNFTLDSFESGIFAISRVLGRCSTPRPDSNIRSDHSPSGRQISGGGCGADESGTPSLICVMSSASHCALPWSLPLDVTFGLSFKFHTKIKGWLHGRLMDAVTTIGTADNGDQLLSIQGKPSVVPAIHAWYPKNNLPSALRNFYADKSPLSLDAGGGGWASSDGKFANGPDGLPYSVLKLGSNYNAGSFDETLAWINSVGDKATYAPTAWAFRSIEGKEYESCMRGSSSLSGLVSTNSTMYVGNPPTFDKASQSLNYKVMSPHYLPNGEEFKGSYDLIIRSDVARCIYGFSKAPVSATISILSSDGSSQVATTTFNERDGWMYLVARGFTFSSPTIRVKLSQEAAPMAVVPKLPSKIAPKKTTITCVKGKTSKKVSAVKPACPAGWKKK
jgi:hypothetical protein